MLFGQILVEQPEKVSAYIYEHTVASYREEGKEFSSRGAILKQANAYIHFLESFIKNAEVCSIVDIGCGDWTLSKYVQWGDVKYTGIDVVKSIVEENQKKSASPTLSLIRADALQTDLPSADLLVCKDVLQHLTTQDITLFLEQLGKFKHCLITNDVDPKTLSGTNREIRRGDYRTLDLTKPPFHVQGTKILTYNAGGIIKQVLYIRNPD